MRLSNKDDGPSLVWKWGERDTRRAFENKRYIFGFGTDTLKAYAVVEKNWGADCFQLFENFLEWMADRREEKIELVYDAAANPSEHPLQSLHAHRDEHFSAVLKMFDEAIDAVKAPEPTSNEAPATTAPLPSDDTVAPDVAPPSTEPTAEDDLSPSPAPLPATEGSAPSTPPPRAPPTLPGHLSSPTPPSRKRRSEDGEHPESPRSKARRVHEGLVVTGRSP